MELDISHTGIARLPPGLGGATSLRCLKMAGTTQDMKDPALRLSDEDVDILLQLTAMHELLLGEPDSLPAAVVGRLRRQAAPQLNICHDDCTSDMDSADNSGEYKRWYSGS